MSRVLLALAAVVAVAACSADARGPSATAAPPGNDGPNDSPPPETKPAPPPCDGKPGTLHNQAFKADDETRHYWLHVPASYTCETAAALVVDFHGTGFGSETDAVEESWATPELISAADDLGFIVVRPRSRMKATNGGFYYQWDINPGDVAKNKAFATSLVEDLRKHYHIAETRLYGTGFSNGPSMAAQFLGDEPSLFKGYGLIAGGLNAPLTRDASFGASAPRIYTMTGFRDYMLLAKDLLDEFLKTYAFPGDKLFDREADTGHEVYGWHFREAFAWMDAGTRPPPGQVGAAWTAESGVGDESLVEITTDPAGALVGFGARGGIYARGASSR